MGGGGWVVLGRIMGEMGIAVIKQKHFLKIHKGKIIMNLSF